MTNVKPGVDRGIDLTLPNCLLYCYRSHSNASHLPCQQTFPSPLRLYSMTIQCQTPRLLWSKIYCLIILHISKTALKPLYWPLPTGCRCRKTKIEWNDWRTEKTSSRTDSSKCPVMREVLNSWDSLWFQLVLSNNVQLKKWWRAIEEPEMLNQLQSPCRGGLRVQFVLWIHSCLQKT